MLKCVSGYAGGRRVCFLYVFACGALQGEASSAGPAGKQPSRMQQNPCVS